MATGPPAFLRTAAHPLRWQLLAALADSDYRVRELSARVDEPQNLVSYHLRLLRDAGLVTATRSSSDGRDSYYHLDLDRCARELADSGSALHPALRHDPTGPAAPLHGHRGGPVAVLFVCTGNSSRSPIAEALLRHRTTGRVTATSAGSRPKPDLHPNTIRVLRESYGVDPSAQRPRHVDTLDGRRFDRVITLCDRAREVCPDFPGHPRRAHWSVPDPATPGGTADATYPAFQRVAAEIDTRIGHLLPVLTEPVHQKDPP
ncbi:arsenate reductase/protein-tyrosine-phosphatase family protein [Pseudonocardia humida]|uniref:arsenate reductase/protein-tyrosine-phosphatase family protein n=1 Tax=Pseudonocardia humida TaxID=2800819 RepID=UPI00207D63D1|nr:ArsR family transcriptional regulator [Pseudonocardia humida]